MISQKPRIAIMQLGLVPDALTKTWPSYGQMIINWLSSGLHEVDYDVLSIVEGEALPKIGDYDGIVYSGSRHSVYDDLPWIGPLKEFVKATATLHKPQFGICFGHQLMAEALGGGVVKSASGWGCGFQQYKFDDGARGSTQLSVLIMHQDQVVSLPSSAKLLGGSDFCPNGITEYPQNLRSVQFHPEFDAEYVAALLALYQGSLIPLKVAEHATNTLKQEKNQDLVLDWASAFFREHFQ